ncbi:hypothetical protein RW64_01460 [Geobacter sulfurreducens]|nr:hypothetical protein RW64_01460 [Geobacter sulfurreducens]
MVTLLGPASFVWAEGTGTTAETRLDEMVVTANRVDTPTNEVGSSITVITAREIEQRKSVTLLDVLRTVPGLDVVQQGGMGGTASVFMRGANSEHTLVLLDGIELNDPSSTGAGFDFANLPTANIDRVEILRGPQSTLYGSHAMGGVINIITKKGQGKPTGFLSAEGGSYYTAIEKGGISGGTNLYNYSLGVTRRDTAGFSTAGRKYGNTENDGDQNTSVNTRLGITPTENLSVDLFFNYLKSRTDLDNNGGAGGDDPNYVQKSEQYSFRAQGDLALFEHRWEQRLGVSLNDLSRDFTNGTDPAHPSDSSRGSYHGQDVKIDWQHTLHLHETNSLTLGIERKEENAKSDYNSESAFGPYSSTFSEKYAHTTGFYLQDQIRLWDSWFTTLGVRLDDHSRFGTQATYRFTTSYLIKQSDTRFKGSYGTGFKSPSLYQLYSEYGDTGLNPEKSTGWDIGVEQALFGKKMVLGATYFRNDFENLIDFVSIATAPYGQYQNIGKARTQGAEVTATLRPLDELTLKLGYTYTWAEDLTNGQELLRRPKNKASLDANYRFLKDANVNLGVVYVGSRIDKVFDPVTYASSRVTMKDYVVVNLAASYDITKNLQLFGRVDNLLDRNYEEVTGYGTAGISAYGGVKVSF